MNRVNREVHNTRVAGNELEGFQTLLQEVRLEVFQRAGDGITSVQRLVFMIITVIAAAASPPIILKALWAKGWIRGLKW